MTIDWTSATEMARDLLAAKYLCLICLGAIVVDFGHSLRFDYYLLSGKKGKGGNQMSWPQVCYFGAKLIYFPYWVVTFITGEPSYPLNCQVTISLSEVLMGVLTCLCSALLAFRAVCVWQQRCGKLFKIIMFLLWFGLLAVWMVGAPDVRGSWVTGIGSPWVEDQGACIFNPIPFRYAIKFVVTVAFDTMILLLTVIGVMETRIKTRLGSVLVEQGTIYVVLAVGINVMLVTFAWINMNDVMTVVLSVPAQTISVMTATRLFVLLHQESAKKHSPYKDSTSLPSFSSPSKVVQAGSLSSFPTYINKDAGHADMEECGDDTLIDPKPPFHDYSSEFKTATNSVSGGGKNLNLKNSMSTMKLSYDERDPFAKRPNTSPAAIQHNNQRKYGPSVFIHETISVVSEPMPAHLQGQTFLIGQPTVQKKQKRPSTGVDFTKQ